MFFEEGLQRIARQACISRSRPTLHCSNPECAHEFIGFNTGIKMQECSGCRNTRYCSKACQKQHWKHGHKLQCQKIQERISSSDKFQAATAVVAQLEEKLGRAWPQALPHQDAIMAMASSRLAILKRISGTTEARWTLAIIFTSIAHAKNWVNSPCSLPAGCEVRLLPYQSLCAAQSPADEQVVMMHNTYPDPKYLHLHVEIKYKVLGDGEKGVASKQLVIGGPSFEPGDAICLRNGQSGERGVVVSCDWAQKSCMIQFADGSVGNIWSHNLQPEATEPAAPLTGITHICPVDEELSGRAARRRYRKGVEETFQAAAGKRLQTELPGAYSALKKFEEAGSFFEALSIATPSQLMKVPCPVCEKYYTDLPPSALAHNAKQKDEEGGICKTWSWEQRGDEVHLQFALSMPPLKGDIAVTFRNLSLKVAVKREVLIDGSLWGPVDVDGCTWCLAANCRELQVLLTKMEADEWDTLLKSEVLFDASF